MSLYSGMARQNIKKNYRFFIPRILTEAGLLASFYIVFTLAGDSRMRTVRGGSLLPSFMAVGAAVIALLSVVLMLYTNSFLMKQRKREFGLYNVLGMEKRHVGKVLFRESLYSSLAGITAGTALGILFYKLCSLLICRLLGVESVLGFYYISPATVIPSVLGFLAIDLLTCLYNRYSIGVMKPVELMASAQTGEKEPKVRPLMLILGTVSLAAGYYLAVATRDPLEAIACFFIAVFLVIIGTYFLFVTGTTFVLQRLKNRKSYYYRPKHMTAVSGLLYRMKQNAVGLASICILATGVLIMISSTVSLYAGSEETLANNYPMDLYMNATYRNREEQKVTVSSETLEGIVREAAAKNGLEIEKITAQRYLEFGGAFADGVCILERVSQASSSTAYYDIITADTYRALTGSALALSGNQVAFCSLNTSYGKVYDGDTLTIGGAEYRITERLTYFPLNAGVTTAYQRYGIVVSGEEALQAVYEAQREAYGSNASGITEKICVKFTDREKACEAGPELEDEISRGVRDFAAAQPDAAEFLGIGYFTDTVWKGRDEIHGMNGSFLFLGILLGLVCLFATALIIYYKQISEGYEDRNRYQIMEKIGMSQKEVRESIRSQVRKVFFLPLAAAGVHVCFAFPMVLKMLKLLLLSRATLFILCTGATFLVFALVYVVIYSVTAKTYYKIVH